MDAHATKQITKTLNANQSSINVRVVASSPTSVSVYATSSQSGETFLPTETLTAGFTTYASVTGITGYTNASLLDKTNKTFDLIAADGKVYNYEYDATNIRQNNSTVDVATFEAELSKGARVTVAKDAAGNIYYNIVETNVTVPVQATINKLIADGVTTINNAAITAAGGTAPTATDDITINSPATTLTVNLTTAKHLTVNAANATTVDISGNYTDLTVNANLAHVTYTGTSTVSGTTTINAASSSSFVVDTAATVNNVVINDTDGVKFTNNGTVNGTITVATSSPVVIDGTGTPAEVNVTSNTANIVAPNGTTITAVNPAGVTAKDSAGNDLTVDDKAVVGAEAAVKAEAEKITSVEVVNNQVVLPTVANGYTVAIKSSSDEAVISKAGKVTPKWEDTTVELVLTVSSADKKYTADTVKIEKVVDGTAEVITLDEEVEKVLSNFVLDSTGARQVPTDLATIQNALKDRLVELQALKFSDEDAAGRDLEKLKTLTTSDIKIYTENIKIDGDKVLVNGPLFSEAAFIVAKGGKTANYGTPFNITLVKKGTNYDGTEKVADADKIATIEISADGTATIK